MTPPGRKVTSSALGTFIIEYQYAAGYTTAAAAGEGAADAGRLEIRIDEISGTIATVTVHSETYVEYLHLVETPDGWQIVNALWRYADGHGPTA